VKILFTGLGSIGRRHARSLRTVLGDSVDLIAWRSRRLECSEERELGIRRVDNLESGLAERPDAVFITNPSALHLRVAQAAADAGCALFIEKPLADRWEGVDRLVRTVERSGIVAMLGYQMRFHPGLRRLRDLLRQGAIGRTILARLDFGEYLPGWHPDEDYRDSYAAKRSLGGGVLLTQIHEFDYLCWLWGLPERIYSTGGWLTRLEVDVEDVVVTQLEYGRDAALAFATVHLDYLRRPPVRSCEVIGEDGRITVNLLDGRLVRTGTDGITSIEEHAFTRNDLFVDEVRHFLSCLAGTESPIASLRDGAMSLRLALAARQSIVTHQPVEVSDDVVVAEP
jgi:predicted dehydrogenase